jgi:lipopolysaccharide export LptBFGC system permease protein LptF
MYAFGGNSVLDSYLQADHAEPGSSNTWLLHDVVQKHYGRDGGIHTQRLDVMPWNPPWRQTTALYELPLESLSLPELAAHRRYLAQEDRPSGLYALEFWRRVLMPASGIVFTLFGAPFVLGVGPRSSMGGAVSLGVANALLMFLVQQIGTNAIFLATGSSLLAVGLPIVAVLGLAMVLIRRINGAPR